MNTNSCHYFIINVLCTTYFKEGALLIKFYMHLNNINVYMYLLYYTCMQYSFIIIIHILLVSHYLSLSFLLGDPHCSSDYKPGFLTDDELKQLVVEVLWQ